MQWIHDYQLFLFDLDGLLVNTEQIHFQAYRNMLALEGCDLSWDFQQYCLAAHYGNEKLRNEIYRTFPTLSKEWERLYSVKQAQVVELLKEGEAHLMPGVEGLLSALKVSDISSCVVTNSKKEFVDLIREKNPVLNQIPYWLTRGDYTKAKPHPEGYLMAIERYSKPGSRVIGFEDTPRGIHSLLQTEAKAVMVSNTPYPDLPELLKSGVHLYPSLEELAGSSL